LIDALGTPFKWEGMTMYEWMQCDMQWLYEAQTVMTAFREGQRARQFADAEQTKLRTA
jgi:hypothetical protein